MVRHYYHIYANGRNWFEPLQDHLTALIETGLYYEVRPLRIGFVGSETNIQKVKAYLDERQIEYISIAESPSGWEQVTLDQLYSDALESDFKILYAHTKGATYKPISDLSAGYRDLLARYWRQDMTNELTSRWQEAVELLDTYDLAGIYWVPKLNFYAGNFWYATSEYIRTLGPPDNSNRWDAEAWIRKNRALKAYNMLPGFPTFSRDIHYSTGRPVEYWENPLHKEIGMRVTFRCDGRVLKYSTGKIYNEELTPLLKKLLEKGEHLVLIDPPSIEQLNGPAPKPAPVAVVEVVEESTPEPEVVDHGSDESADIPEATRPVARQDYGNRTEKKSGERSHRGEELSSEE